jgi:Leucine-rich repeat (LRR) protein
MQNQKIVSGKSVWLHTVTAIMISFLFLFNLNAQLTPESEIDALMAIYEATGGENWTRSYNWGVGNPATIPYWRGVSCNSDGNVISLGLWNNNLVGELPPEIGELTFLEEIALYNNHITNLPSEIGSLQHLKKLLLAGNQLTSIPVEISELDLLQTLWLQGNQLSGIIPLEICSLSTLETLELRGNQFTTIPPEINGLTSLKDLDISENILAGSIPGEIGDLSELKKLWLFGNQLTGNIPPEIGKLTALTALLLQDNQLSGNLPTEIGNMISLEALSLKNNQISGSIPSSFGNLTRLANLHLGYNELTGEIPPELGNMESLWALYLYGNNLSGEIPPEFGNLDNIQYFSLGMNQLSGNIPKELANMTAVKSIHLSSNNLTGSIPRELGILPNLYALSLDDNHLTGTIPSELASPNRNGWIAIRLNDNELTGSIPPEFGYADLYSLYLQNNMLSGCFDAALKSLCNLNNIDLSGNPDLPDFNSFCNDGTGTCITCFVDLVTSGTQTSCLSIDNSYSQELTISYIDPPEDGFLVVNGQQFPIEVSPQTIILTGLVADGQPVDVNAYFSSNTECGFTAIALFTAPEPCFPPLAICKDVVAYADENCTAVATIDDGSNDPDGDPITITLDPPGPYYLGNTTVTLTVSDGSSSASCSSVVTVVDNSIPVPNVNPLPVIIGECAVTVETIPTAMDNCSGAIEGITQAPLFYPEQGEYFIDWSFEDEYGNILTQQQKIIVDDITPPVLVPKTPPVEVFEKSIHQPVTFTIDQLIESVSDNCTYLTFDDITIIRVESDEDEDGDMPEVNDGRTSDDIVIEDGCQSVTLMAECDLNSNGRVYTIYLEVNDYNGNTTVATTEVHVIHKNIESALNDGPFYIITSCGKPDKLKSAYSIEIVEELTITNFPNPFNDKTTFEFNLPHKGNVNIALYDMVGKKISVILNEVREKGNHKFEFNGSSLNDGVYFYKLVFDKSSITKQIILHK